MKNFRATCRRLKQYVEKHAGATMHEAVAAIEHHYRSDADAHHALTGWVKRGLVEGVRIRKRGDLNRLFVQKISPPLRKTLAKIRKKRRMFSRPEKKKENFH